MEGTNISYEKRATKALNPAGKRLFELMEEKETNLALSNDEVDPKRFLELSEKLGPEIAVLKTHVDIIRDFSPTLTQKLSELSKKYNFMILEDSKLADIGNTVKLQYSEGVYRIADWANLLTVHVVPGPGIIKGIGEVIKEKKDRLSRGMLLLAQMTSEGTLATGKYTEKAVEFGNSNKDVVAGYIGASDIKEIDRLVKLSFSGHLILTPGIQIKNKGDSLGQQYLAPEEAILAGSDCIIVGRGIYKAENPLEMAKTYRKAGWEAYLERIGGR